MQRHLLQHEGVQHAASSMRQAALYSNVKKSLRLCHSYTSEVSIFSCIISITQPARQGYPVDATAFAREAGVVPTFEDACVSHTHTHTHTQCLDYIPETHIYETFVLNVRRVCERVRVCIYTYI
jgi:hypothetical protein